MCAYWVGADPGGKGAFGLALLDEEGGLRCDTVSSVHQAVTEIEAAGEPLGLGIDAPMWWCAGEGGGRMVDQKLRDHYGISSGTVQAANSLRGAALIGGALLASRVRRSFPGARITESHPKALLLAFNYCDEEFAEKYGISRVWRNEHERDAAIAAVCAREGFEGGWRTNLAEQRYPLEQDPQDYWLKPMFYFWPESI